MIMNRKIFTLLASALMLFSMAFTANAKIIGGDKSIGDVVRTLPLGVGSGMYHIRIDSIYNGTQWVLANTASVLIGDRRIAANDTIVLGVTEGGKVIPVSMNNLRGDNIGYKDLQSTMWCIGIEDPHLQGQVATFHFTNKAFGNDLDIKAASGVYVDGTSGGKGWMYSDGYDNGGLRSGWPIRRLNGSQYTVLAYHSMDSAIYAVDAPIASVLAETVDLMLKFSIVEVAPIVLDAEAFNTKLFETTGSNLTQLSFDPAPTSTKYLNYFGEKLKAEDGNTGYLKLKVNGGNNAYIRNVQTSSGTDAAVNADRYTNEYGDKFIRINVGADNNNYNNEYRFVYFPSKDSLVINAFQVGHYGHNAIATGTYHDDNSYKSDAVGAPYHYYGLYNDLIQTRLIVRLQDLYVDGSTLLTIGGEPVNTRISFGINNCNPEEYGWQPANGVYTIWNSEGECLGIRIYNGSLVPQWMKLQEGECPDRIPSYQWVVEKVTDVQSKRVNITNREFGNVVGSDYVKMKNVLIKKDALSQIFTGQQQFLFSYEPFKLNDTEGTLGVRYGEVAGAYVAAIGAGECGISSDESGFRAVTSAYVNDPYLGYKFFNVNTNVNSISYGKSDDLDGANGYSSDMDYTAYAFNYYSAYDDSKYIDLKYNKSDSILFVNKGGGKEAFQFQLGANLRTAYLPENYGYPQPADNAVPTYSVPDGKGGTVVQKVPTLRRYYYELKVADFYTYRDSVAEQYVILKGAASDGSDVNNKLTYGVANAYADKEPLQLTNIYLRETFFFDKGTNDEKGRPQDPTRRVYYTILNRIPEAQFSRIGNMGLEIAEAITDGAKRYGLVAWRVHEVEDGIVKAQDKSVSTVHPSTFALEKVDYQLYRRLNSILDDGAIAGDTDAPKILRFYTYYNDQEFLFEDALSADSDNMGINFLGLANAVQHKEKYNYNLYVDTAYINRGTGKIKPQYLIAVGVDIFDGKEDITPPVDDCSGEVVTTLQAYKRGRYLINATDSARLKGSTGVKLHPVRDKRYISYHSWDRLAFVDAIHVGDRLYIVGEIEKLLGRSIDDYLVTIEVDGKARKIVDVKTLITAVGSSAERIPSSTDIKVYYDFGTWSNYHNDVTFSFRFVDPIAENAGEDGLGGTDNNSKRFRIESETTNRTPEGNRKIAPVQGGWIMMDNGVPVLSRGAYEDAIGQGEIFNVKQGTGDATANDPVISSGASVKVASGVGELSILNANGKDVTVTNILGQKVIATTLNSDKVTLKVPKGIVVVTVGGDTVKAIVK
jgi:hypothetical protein